ncbi:MAG: hypothetical protein HQL49_12385 [Gammaproteobacteria bacterium]|nr:hypothetical protein [Gammaproteobacteria bacterium]
MIYTDYDPRSSPAVNMAVLLPFNIVMAFLAFVLTFITPYAWITIPLLLFFLLLVVIGFVSMLFVTWPLPAPLDRATGQNRQKY